MYAVVMIHRFAYQSDPPIQSVKSNSPSEMGVITGHRLPGLPSGRFLSGRPNQMKEPRNEEYLEGKGQDGVGGKPPYDRGFTLTCWEPGICSIFYEQ